MKKWIALLLAVALCLPLSGCGKSDAYRAVERKIASLGSISAESEQALSEIGDAIDALSAQEQEKIKKNRAYNQALERYYELILPGVWYPFALDITRPKTVYEPQYSLTFAADHTLISKTEMNPRDDGSWKIKNGTLVISGLWQLVSELYSMVPNEDDEFVLELKVSDGAAELITAFSNVYYKEDAYFEKVSEVVKVVDLETADLSEVFGFHSFEYRSTDEWGAHTGSRYEYVCLKNKLFEQGWYYLGTDERFAVEVCYPTYTEHSFHDNGERYTDVIEAGSYTVSENPFNYLYRPLQLNWSHSDYEVKTDLKLDALSIGRGKGKIFFINEKYVTDILHDDVSREMLIAADGADPFLGADTRVYFSVFEENNQDY